MIRRLVSGDEDLLREAWEWTNNSPSWFRDADRVFNQTTLNAEEQLGDRAKWFIGVFDQELEAVVIVERKGNGQFEGHLMARRNANAELIASAINHVLADLLNYGLMEAYCWIAEKNHGVRNICNAIGLRPDGIVMWKGSYKGRVIKWLRYSVQRGDLVMENAA